jgi:hypothetical protein
MRAGPVLTDRPAPASRADRWGPSLVAAMTVAVALSWLPLLTDPLGDNHPGRVAARYGLHIRNLYERGLLASKFSAEWVPYRDEPYAHHPPLLNILDALIGLLPGDGEYQLRIAPLLLALVAIPAGAALLRAFGMRWSATVIAVGAMSVTGYYWIYGQVMFDIGLVLALSAAIVALGSQPVPSVRLVRVTAALALVAALASWPGIAFTVAMGVWLWRKRGFDRSTRVVLGAGAIGLAVSLAFMFGVHGWNALADQADTRTTGGEYTAGEFVDRIWGYMRQLLPGWYRLVLPVALIAGVADRRTRAYVVLSAVFAGSWVVLLNDGAYIHDYWGYLVLVPGLVGTAALVDRIVGRTSTLPIPAPVKAIGAIACAALLAVTFVTLAFGSTADRYLHRPTDAGALIEHAELPADQQYAWNVGFASGRVLAYYWQLPPRRVTSAALDGMGDDEIVLVNLLRVPSWYPTSDVPILDQQGRYALVRASDLRSAVLGR